MKKPVLLFGMLLSVSAAYSQKFITRTGKVTFFSGTPVENIEAICNEAAGIADFKTGQVLMQVPIKSFKFEKSLMQDHFNENYMESDKYPKASFKGAITDPAAVNAAKAGDYKTNLAGELTMHGVTRHVEVPATITVKGGTVVTVAKFKVVPSDYKIAIPSVVSSKIAKEIEITVNVQMTSTN